MKIKRILLPTDFSKTANLALEQAIVLAAKYDAELMVLHARLIHEDDPSQLPEKLAHLELADDQIEGEISNYINDCTNKAAHINIGHEVIRGYSAHSAILSYLNEHPFDLIIIGTHGRSNLENLLLGSVTEKVVRYAPCMVLTISRNSDIKKRFQKVLVPFDFSEHAITALKTAIEITEAGGEIELLYIFEKDVHSAYFAWGLASVLDVLPEVRSKAEQKMDQVVSELNIKKCKINKTITDGVPHKKITEFANKCEADLVVMATQGLVGLDRFLLGSTAERVIRAVHRPILTVKEKSLI